MRLLSKSRAIEMVDGSGQVKGIFGTSSPWQTNTDKSAQSAQLLDEEALVNSSVVAERVAQEMEVPASPPFNDKQGI